MSRWRPRLEIRRNWREGLIAPKSRAGTRTVPIPSVLSAHLARQRLAYGASGLFLGRTPETPFQPTSVVNRARRAWSARRAWKDAGLEPITLHEARHTFASMMIAAGVNAKALSTYMGHAGVSITYDRYGHLMPGNEAEAAGLLDAYLSKAAGYSEDLAKRLAKVATATPPAPRLRVPPCGRCTRRDGPSCRRAPCTRAPTPCRSARR
jgi:integrase